jgi:hypothetical protein
MEIKRQVGVNPLLQAREEALRNAEMRSLRPMGKLWGMDVFTWYDPTVYELSATLQTFPFPVYWLGTEKQVAELASVDPEVMRGLSWIAQFDNAQLRVPGDVMAPIPLVTATETLEDAMTVLKSVKQSRHILLFTVSGNEWKMKMELFEEFVKLHA